MSKKKSKKKAQVKSETKKALEPILYLGTNAIKCLSDAVKQQIKL